MPELPDVQIFKRYMDSTSLHHKIKNVSVNSTKVLESVSEKHLKSKLKNRSFESTKRYGKYLFAKTDQDFWLVLHFGMTGNIKYFKSDTKTIKHIRVLFCFTNDYHLAYISQRMLGRISLADSVETFIEKQKWGPDVMEIGYDTFKKIIQKSRGAIKSTLMNQKLLAGIGNVYSDEILFQSKIHPKKSIAKLNQDSLEDIYHNMKKVLIKATRWQADPHRFSNSYLLSHRDEDDKCPRCGSQIDTLKISGRTAYFCPNCQTKT